MVLHDECGSTDTMNVVQILEILSVKGYSIRCLGNFFLKLLSLLNRAVCGISGNQVESYDAEQLPPKISVYSDLK